jgi:hypothetical protein
MMNIKRKRSDASCTVANRGLQLRPGCLPRWSNAARLRAQQRVPALCRSMVLRTSRRGRDDPTPPTGSDAMARSLDQ